MAENQLKEVKCPRCGKLVDSQQAVCNFFGADLSMAKKEQEHEIVLSAAVKEYMNDLSKREQELLRLDEQTRQKEIENRKVEERLKIRIDAIKAELDKMRFREYKLKQREQAVEKTEKDLAAKGEDLKARLNDLTAKEEEFGRREARIKQLEEASSKDLLDLGNASVDEKLIRIGRYNEEIELKEKNVNALMESLKKMEEKISISKKELDDELYRLSMEKEKSLKILDEISRKEASMPVHIYVKEKNIECPRCGSMNSDSSDNCEYCGFRLKGHE